MNLKIRTGISIYGKPDTAAFAMIPPLFLHSRGTLVHVNIVTPLGRRQSGFIRSGAFVLSAEPKFIGIAFTAHWAFKIRWHFFLLSVIGAVLHQRCCFPHEPMLFKPAQRKRFKNIRACSVSHVRGHVFTGDRR